MADIRINSLPSTATSFNTDDYIAIDGASGGTRKMLAATLPLTDVTLGGSSGPSVKSSLSARAPRQGLVFDGAAGATVSIPAFGTSGWTQAFWVYQTQIRGGGQLTYLSGSNGATAPNVAFLDTTNQLIVYNGSSAFYSGYIVPTGKWLNIVVTNNGTTTTFYSNGVQVGSTSDSTNYSGTLVAIGSNGSTNSWLYGSLSGCLIYNRALSSSEVVALYEAGAPAGADYNTASNTAVYSTDFSTSTGWVAESGWSITGGAAVLSGSSAGALFRTATALNPLSRYRITFTVASYVSGGVKPWIQIGSSRVRGTARTANGTYTEELVAPSATGTSYVGVEASTSSSCSLSVDDYAYYAAGLLLAPDAGQAGGGLTWYDTSGNAANITLPASGVTWNVPTSGKMASALNITNTTDSSSKDTGSLILEGGLGVEKAATIGGNLTAQGTLHTFGSSNKAIIQMSAGTGALPAGGWIYGSDEGLGISPNGTGLNKKLAMAYWDGSAYRSALEFSNVSSGTATLKLSDYGGLTTVGGNITVSGASYNDFTGALWLGTTAGYGTLNVGNVSGTGTATYSCLTIGDQSTPANATGLYMRGTSAVCGISTAGAPIAFFTGGPGTSEAARFFNNGNFGIGTTTDGGQKLQVSGTAAVVSSGTDQRTFLATNSAGSAEFGVFANGKGYIGTTTNDNFEFYSNNTLALTLDSSQNATFAGSVVPSAIPSSKWGLDFTYGSSSGTYVTIANDGTVDLAAGSGMVFIWDDGGSGVSQIMCYYGQTAILWQDSTLYTVTVDTANKVNVYYNSGTSRYRIQNKSGSSKSFNISTIRLRTSA